MVRRRGKGYSLLELVITITIMSILLMSVAQLFASQIQQIQRLRIVTAVTEIATLHDLAYQSNEQGIGSPTVELFLDRQYGAGQVAGTNVLWGDEDSEFTIVKDTTLPRAAYEFQHRNGRSTVCYIPPDNPMVGLNRKVLLGPCATQGDALTSTNTDIPAPTAVVGSVNGSVVELSWTPLDPGFGTVLYTVYRCESTITTCIPGQVAGTTSGAVFMDPNRPAGTEFTYTVTSSTAFGTSTASLPVQVSISPLAPVLTAAVWEGEQVMLRWSPPFQGITQVSSYDIWRCVSPCVPSSLDVVGSEPATATVTYGFDDDSISLGTTYTYAVVATNPAGQSLADAAVIDVLTPPDAPTNLTVTVDGTAATLTWDTTATATSYVVRRCAGEICITVNTLTGTSYVDDELPVGTYTWTVTAVNAAGPSPVNASETGTIFGS